MMIEMKSESSVWVEPNRRDKTPQCRTATEVNSIQKIINGKPEYRKEPRKLILGEATQCG